jgi:tRNA(Ile)-lysidine synthase
MKKSVWAGLDHKIWKQRDTWPPFARILIALSGGIDSVALCSVFRRLSLAGDFEVIVANVHHGLGKYEEWRTRAQEHCRQFCLEQGLPFIAVAGCKAELASEDELRSFRYSELRRIQKEQKCDLILTAHHADDLLETRLLRLMRGTGPEGLEAIRDLDNALWRPFLRISRAEIAEYMKQTQLKAIEDPSNMSLDPMRNWLRQDLLPHIEARQLGLVHTLSRSLQLIVEAIAHHQLPPLNIEQSGGTFCLERGFFFSQTPSEQRTIIAKLLVKLGVKNYSHGQIAEIHRRLDNSQKVHNFRLGSMQWRVDAKQVCVCISA